MEADQAVVSRFEQLRIPPEAIEELKAILAKGPAMENITLSALTIRDIASNFTASHFEVQARLNWGQPTKGQDLATLMRMWCSPLLSTKY